MTLLDPSNAIDPLRRTAPREMSEQSRRRGRALRIKGIAAGGAVLATVLAATLYVLSKNQGRQWLPFSSFTVTKLTSNGNISVASISPDGKYLAFAARLSDNRWSLNLKHLGVGRVEELMKVDGFIGETFTFLPDNKHIVFSVAPSMGTAGADCVLFQIFVLGGSPVPLQKSFDCGATAVFSSDGRRLAYYRWDQKAQRALIFVSNPDGSNERMIVSPDELMLDNPASTLAWSPDSSKLAICTQDQQRRYGIQLLPLAGGSGVFLPTPVALRNPVWLPSDVGIVGLGLDSQIWFQPLPDGPAGRITEEMGSYGHLGLTTDTKTMVSIQTDEKLTSWVSAADGKTGAAQLPTRADEHIVGWSQAGGLFAASANRLARLKRDGTGYTVIIEEPGPERIAAQPCGPNHMAFGHSMVGATDLVPRAVRYVPFNGKYRPCFDGKWQRIHAPVARLEGRRIQEAAFSAARSRGLALGERKKAPYSGEPISLDLTSLDVRDFFRLIGEISGLKVEVDPAIQGYITMRADDTFWDLLFDMVLLRHGLKYQLAGETLRILPSGTSKNVNAGRLFTDLVNTGLYSYPQLSPDGRYVLYLYLENNPSSDPTKEVSAIVAPVDGRPSFQSIRLGRADGMENVRTRDDFPVFRWTPDGKAFVYISYASGTYFNFGRYGTLWLQPLSGGVPQQLATWDDIADFTWMPDGKALTCLRSRRSADEGFEPIGSLWLQPLDGGPGRQLTQFDDVSRFVWSPDGRQLAFTRNERKRDVVMFSVH